MKKCRRVVLHMAKHEASCPRCPCAYFHADPVNSILRTTRKWHSILPKRPLQRTRPRPRPCPHRHLHRPQAPLRNLAASIVDIVRRQETNGHQSLDLHLNRERQRPKLGRVAVCASLRDNQSTAAQGRQVIDGGGEGVTPDLPHCLTGRNATRAFGAIFAFLTEWVLTGAAMRSHTKKERLRGVGPLIRVDRIA